MTSFRALFLALLAVLRPAVEPLPTKPPLLAVTLNAGYTTWLASFQVEGYPLLVLQADGSLIASEHRYTPGAVEYTISRGKLPERALQKLVRALPHLLPAAPEPGGAVVIDAGAVFIDTWRDGERDRRELLRLQPTLTELLDLPGLTAERRAGIQRRLQFAQLLEQLRVQYATEPYVPARAEVVVVPFDPSTVHGRPLAVCEWPVTGLSLPELARASAPESGGAYRRNEIRDPETVATLARTVISNRVYRAGAETYLVAWVPVLP